MKKLLLSGVAMVGLAAPALAADLPARPYANAAPIVSPFYDWTGFYIGANGGGAASHDCFTVTSVNGVAVNQNSEGCHNATGAVAGDQVGYRWQWTNFVFGVEAQGDCADLKGSAFSQTAIVSYLNETKVNALGLFTGQVGFAMDNILLYMKGGAAVTENKYSSFFTATGVVFNAASDTRWGAAVGGGFEIGFAPNWTVGLEYDHLFMGNPSIAFPATSIAVGRSDNVRQGVDMGTVRVNYRFGGPIIPAPVTARY